MYVNQIFRPLALCSCSCLFHPLQNIGDAVLLCCREENTGKYLTMQTQQYHHICFSSHMQPEERHHTVNKAVWLSVKKKHLLFPSSSFNVFVCLYFIEALLCKQVTWGGEKGMWQTAKVPSQTLTSATAARGITIQLPGLCIYSSFLTPVQTKPSFWR